MDDFKVTGVTIKDAQPQENGFQLLAYFNVEYAGLRIFGCMLFKTPKGGLTANIPSIPGQEGRHRAVQIIDNAMRHKLMAAGRNAYRALGGTLAEWEPTAAEPTDEGVRRFIRADQGESDE